MSPWLVPALIALAIASVPLVRIDLREHRLPNRITLTLVPVVAGCLALAAWGTGEWDRLARASLAGIALLAAYLALHLAYPAGLGLGDVKLAPSLGLALGWLSWQAVLLASFLAFVLSAVLGLALIAMRRATLKSALPFGPFMLAGAWLVIAASVAASLAAAGTSVVAA